MRESTPRRRWATALIATTTAVPLLFSGAATAAWAAAEPETTPEIVEQLAPATDHTIPETPAEEPPVAELPDAPVEQVATVAPTAARDPQPASTNDPQLPLTLTIDTPDRSWPWYDAPIDVRVRASSRIGADISIVWSTTGAQNGSGEVAGTDLTIPISANGSTRLTVSAVDSEGNSTGDQVRTIGIDATTPTATLRFPVAKVYRVGEAMTVDYGCESAFSGIDTCTFSFGSTVYDDGDVIPMDQVGTFNVVTTAINRAGTWGQDRRVMRVIEDEDVAPVVAVDAPPASGGWYSEEFFVTFHGDDGDGSGVSSVEYRETVGGVTTPWQKAMGDQVGAPVRGDGTHTFEARAADAFGNVSEIETITFDLDTTAPSIDVSLPADGVTVEPGDDLVLEYSCADALSGLALCSGDVENGGLLDTSEIGTFTVTVRARDDAGNETVVERTYTVAEPDTTGPSIAFRHEPPTRTGWFHTAPEIELEVSDDSAIAEFRWTITAPDGSVERHTVPEGETTAVLSPALFGEGVWEVVVVAVDEFGNTSSVGGAIRIDGDAPTVTIDSPANGAASLRLALAEVEQGDDVAFEFTCSDAVSGIASCESSVGDTLPSDELGTFTAEVVALDEAGHRTVQSLEYTVVAAKPGANPGSSAGVPTLARTGTETAWQTALLALGLLVVGGAAAGSVVMVRRGR